VAADVNDAGTVVGTRAGNAVVWQRRSLRELPGLGGESAAVAVNNRDVVAGWSESAAGERHAVIWRAGRLIDLGPGEALDINKAGVVAGATPDGAVIWRGTRVQPLGLQGVAQAVADSGLVAGAIYGDFTQLFVWDRGDVSIVTESISGDVHAVNNRGVVAGDAGFYDRATLWRP
jgi:probable HAF family extracellular repeat protein